MKVPANDDSGNAKPGHKNPGDEFVRAHRRQRGVKTDNDDAVESEPGADFGFVPGRRQPERDRPGGEKVRRMRLEGQHRAWRRALAGKGNRTLDDRLMAKMQAIEISDRVNRAFKPIGRRHGIGGEDEIVTHFVLPKPGDHRPIPSIRMALQTALTFLIRSWRGMPRLGRRRNAENAFAIKHDLIADATLAMQSDASILLGQFNHLYAHVDDVPDFDRAEEA